jgi:hypothetical protein
MPRHCGRPASGKFEVWYPTAFNASVERCCSVDGWGGHAPGLGARFLNELAVPGFCPVCKLLPLIDPDFGLSPCAIWMRLNLESKGDGEHVRALVAGCAVNFAN